MFNCKRNEPFLFHLLMSKILHLKNYNILTSFRLQDAIPTCTFPTYTGNALYHKIIYQSTKLVTL